MVYLEDAIVVGRRRGILRVKALRDDRSLRTVDVYINEGLVEFRNCKTEIWIPEWLAKKQGLRHQA